MKLDFDRVGRTAVRFWRSRVGRIRTSTVVLMVAFIALWWVQQEYRPATPTPSAPDTQVVPPGFVPDPEYTWVPRTKLQTPRTTTPTETPETTTTTEPTEATEATEPSEATETTGPGVTTTPTVTTTPPPGAPRTTVIDPDGAGLLPPITLPVFGGPPPGPPAEQPQPGQESVAPTLPR